MTSTGTSTVVCDRSSFIPTNHFGLRWTRTKQGLVWTFSEESHYPQLHAAPRINVITPHHLLGRTGQGCEECSLEQMTTEDLRQRSL